MERKKKEEIERMKRGEKRKNEEGRKEQLVTHRKKWDANGKDQQQKVMNRKSEGMKFSFLKMQFLKKCE